MITLIPIDRTSPDHLGVLYRLLEQRTPEQSIRHREMPTFEQHCAFVRSDPYAAWYLIALGTAGVIGSAYLTRAREVGMFIFKGHHDKGYATTALEQLRALHPGPLFANVNPHNEASLRFFQRRGARLIQHTFEL
jgi:RimJ/RimL family protein N-acetyltransferase